MQYTYRPLPVWPHAATPAAQRRSRWTFKASWPDTLELLERELRHLGGRDVVFGVGLRPEDIRLDGAPRANARPLSHPGVELSFDSRLGRLTYSTDVCVEWQHNVRSIALGLEALRAVDRYGISARGQQYAGFAALPAGDSPVERGRKLVEAAGSVRAAQRAHHPDVGGDVDDFRAVGAYAASLEGR